MTNQDEHISPINNLPINPDDPKLCWIFHDEDFIWWNSERSPQVLWLFDGPSGCRMSDFLSHIANEATGAVLYLSCSSVSTTTTFAHSILRHILEISDDRQAKLITTTFLGTLLRKILFRRPSYLREEDSSITTVEKILDASASKLLEALMDSVVQMKEFQETSIFIDQIDKLNEEEARFLEKFSSQAVIGPKFKVLFTCQSDPNIKKRVAEGLCIEHKERQRSIEYDKERQGLGVSYPLFVSLF